MIKTILAVLVVFASVKSMARSDKSMDLSDQCKKSIADYRKNDEYIRSNAHLMTEEEGEMIARIQERSLESIADNDCKIKLDQVEAILKGQ